MICAWCGRWHAPDMRGMGDDVCDLNMAVIRIIAILLRDLRRVVASL